jgi:hypothetical protein
MRGAGCASMTQKHVSIRTIKHVSFSNPHIGLISVGIGVVAWLLILMASIGQIHLSELLCVATAGVGFAFGTMSVKSRVGVIGIFLNLLVILYFLFLVALWALYSPGS